MFEHCAGCGKILWFWQMKSWAYTGEHWLHSDYFGDSLCRRLDWEKYIKDHPEESNPVSNAMASHYKLK